MNESDRKRLAEIEVARYESRHSLVTAITLHRPLAVGSTFTRNPRTRW